MALIQIVMGLRFASFSRSINFSKFTHCVSSTSRQRFPSCSSVGQSISNTHLAASASLSNTCLSSSDIVPLGYVSCFMRSYHIVYFILIDCGMSHTTVINLANNFPDPVASILVAPRCSLSVMGDRYCRVL